MRRLLRLVSIAVAALLLSSTVFGQTLSQLAEVMGTQPGSQFGFSVAVSGNTAVVAAPSETVGCQVCGVAYVFTETGGDWSNPTLVATLTQTGGAGDAGFGGAVAISGNTIVVSGSDADLGGAAYIFVEPEGGWADMTQTAELTFSTEQTAGSVFGVAIDGDVVVVGTATESIGGNTYQGAAYVYVKPSSGWTNMTQTAELVATDGRAYSLLGASVGVSGRNVVAGAPETTIGGVLKAGLAYLFVEPADGWSGTPGQTTEFEASDGTPEAYFGTSVSVSGNVVAVGAPNGVVNSDSPRGIAYIFEKPAAGWPKTMTETAELTAKNGKGGDALGHSVVVSGKAVTAGAPLRENGQGAAYVFPEPAAGWQSTSSAKEITASDDYFGWCVAIGDGVLVVGASEYTNSSVYGNGAAYVFGKSQ